MMDLSAVRGFTPGKTGPGRDAAGRELFVFPSLVADPEIEELDKFF
jgi:hypothetical protein